MFRLVVSLRWWVWCCGFGGLLVLALFARVVGSGLIALGLAICWFSCAGILVCLWWALVLWL